MTVSAWPLLIEALILFFVLPTIICVLRLRVPALPMLWILMAYCLWILRRLHKLDLVRIDTAGFSRQLPTIAAVFLPFVVLVTAGIYHYARHDLFNFVRGHPWLWAAVMVGYPILSVYPQGIIYRAFLFERYRGLFPYPWLILMSTLAFAYVHVIFRNWIAVALTAVGGLLFATRYGQSGSLFISCFEHALYGCWLFTVGLGRSFFYEAGWKQQSLVLPERT